MTIVGQAPLPPLTAAEVLQKMVCDCDSSISQKPGQNCQDLGDEKHDCVDAKIKEHNAAGGKPRIGSEMGWQEYIDPLTDMPAVEMIPGARKKLPRRLRSGTKWPDAVSFDANGDPQQCFDFKFKCPTSTYAGAPAWGNGQEAKYRRLTRMWGKDPDKYPPTKISNTDC
jgi:hypothetical protein